MVVLDKKCFKLPYVDSFTYRELLRLGLRYDRAQRTYSGEDLDSASLNSVLELLSKILHDKVSFEQTTQKPSAPTRAAQKCIACGKSFACDECRYFELCETKNVPSSCVCGKCLEEDKAAQ